MKPEKRTARRQIDQRLGHLRSVQADATVPHRGWTRAIRDALGMSQRELGVRMGIVHSAVEQLERTEPSGRVQLDTLRRAADALECDLVYAFVPRIPLEQLVKERAQVKARLELLGVAHTMRLEDQSTPDATFVTLIEDRAQELIDRRGLWTDDHTGRHVRS